MKDVKIWKVIYQVIVKEKRFVEVGDEFWEFYKNKYDPQIDSKMAAEYYEEYMKKTLHRINIDKTIVLNLFRVLRIPVPVVIRSMIEKQFSVVLKIDAENIILDYDNIQRKGNDNAPPPRSQLHPVQSSASAAKRIVRRRSAFTYDDDLEMAKFLYEKMEDAIKNKKQIFAKGNLIWRDFRIEVSRERAVRNLRSHFCRFTLKNLHNLRMPKKKVLKMYKYFQFEIDRRMKEEIEDKLGVVLKVEQNLLKYWRECVENDDEEVREEKKEIPGEEEFDEEEEEEFDEENNIVDEDDDIQIIEVINRTI